jgi:hypothetical protein
VFHSEFSLFVICASRQARLLRQRKEVLHRPVFGLLAGGVEGEVFAVGSDVKNPAQEQGWPFAVPRYMGERALHRIVGVGVFGWLLDVSGWNRPSNTDLKHRWFLRVRSLSMVQVECRSTQPDKPRARLSRRM